MASSVIHMAIAKEVNKELKRNENLLLIGSIAPDISKHLGDNKLKSHFLDDLKEDIPNLERFLEKYKDNLDDDFVMGYYIHLITDKFWQKYFMSEILKKGAIKKLNGEVFFGTKEEIKYYIYNDYTNLNKLVIDEYELSLKVFYSEVPEINNIIEEIPMDKINLIIEKAGIIVSRAGNNHDYVFDLENIKQFISLSVALILADLKEKGAIL